MDIIAFCFRRNWKTTSDGLDTTIEHWFHIVGDDGYLRVGYYESHFVRGDNSYSFYVADRKVAEVQNMRGSKYLWIYSGKESSSVTYSEFRGWLLIHYPVIVEWIMFNNLDLFRTIMKDEKYKGSD